MIDSHSRDLVNDYHRWACFCGIWNLIYLSKVFATVGVGAPSWVCHLPWSWSIEQGFSI